LIACVGCGESFEPHRHQAYCSQRCKWRVKSRKRYVPKPRVLVMRTCDFPGCSRPHDALGLCKSHHAKHKGYKRSKRVLFVVGGLVAGAGRSLVCQPTSMGGAWVFCPRCEVMLGVPDGSRPDLRVCLHCDLVALVNMDELEMELSCRPAA
jgi:hypothetical protein